MKALIINKMYKKIEDVKFVIKEKEKPSIDENTCLIKVLTVGINPSDALATLGYFPHSKLPRIPGRDFSGVVVNGPTNLIGKQVWGTGGAAGISFDGSLAEYLQIPISAVAEIPCTLDSASAGAQVLPYVTAYYGLVKRAHIQENETVLIAGALGQVGQAAMSICQWKGCKPIALVRGDDSVRKAESMGWTAYNTESIGFMEKIFPDHGGADVIFNSIGNIIWKQYLFVLKDFGRIVTIGAKEGKREVDVNLHALYRANQELIGINTVSLDYSQNAKLLNELKVGFELGGLLALQADKESRYSLEKAHLAFHKVLNNISNNRVTIEL